MAKTKTAEKPQSTVAARRALEAQRQADNNTTRAQLVKETLASRKTTTDFLKSKPTDTRGLERP